MTRDDSLFSSITKINSGKVIFRDNSKGKIIGVGNIGGKSSPSIEKVFLMNDLKYNLLSISQLCDKEFKIMFNHVCCLILENDKVLFISNIKGNVYKIKIYVCIRIKGCLIASINNSFLFKLVKNKLVKELP
jgi:hypothetical protein